MTQLLLLYNLNFMTSYFFSVNSHFMEKHKISIIINSEKKNPKI